MSMILFGDYKLGIHIKPLLPGMALDDIISTLEPILDIL